MTFDKDIKQKAQTKAKKGGFKIQRVAKKVKPPQDENDDTVLFIRNFPKQLHDIFKVWCTNRGVSMRAVVLGTIQAIVMGKTHAFQYNSKYNPSPDSMKYERLKQLTEGDSVHESN